MIFIKKIILLLVAILVFATVIFTSCEEKGPYPKDGKDTVEYFGDARFVILRGYNLDNVKYLDFYDRKDNNGSIDIVYNYKKEKPYVYTVGKKGYTKVNYETGELKQSKDLKDFSDSDKKIFKKLDDEKGELKK